MQRTGHTSTAVRTYKCIGEKLKAVTSDALNTAGEKEQDAMSKPLNNEGSCKELEYCDGMLNRCPMNFAGASHFIVNITIIIDYYKQLPYKIMCQIICGIL